MTDLLQRVVTEIEKLPAADQDALAARILDDLADEHAWDAQFRATTDRQWDCLAEAVRREIAAGQTIPLDDLFPARTPEP